MSCNVATVRRREPTVGTNGSVISISHAVSHQKKLREKNTLPGNNQQCVPLAAKNKEKDEDEAQGLEGQGSVVLEGSGRRTVGGRDCIQGQRSCRIGLLF